MTNAAHVTGSTQLNPLELDGLDGDCWDHARRDYLAGVKATTICQRYGMSLSSFRMHARRRLEAHRPARGRGPA